MNKNCAIPVTPQERRDLLRVKLKEKELDAAWIMQSVDLYYFSGTAQNGHLLVPVDQSETLFIRKYSPRAKQETDMAQVEAFHRMSDLKDLIHAKYSSIEKPLTVGMEMDVVSVQMFNRLKKTFPNWNWVDISSDIRTMRSIKSIKEVSSIRKGAQLLDAVFDRIGGWLKLGMTELELSSKIEGFLRAHGHQGTLPVRAMNSSIHYGNVLFGSNGSVRGSFDGPTCGPGLYPAIPKGAGIKRLNIGEPVFIDLVAGIEGYLCDATRVYCLGELPEILSIAHENCIAIQEKVITNILSNNTCSEIYAGVLKAARSFGFADKFMGPAEDQARFIAHGVGLEIDEYPVIAPGVETPILPGNVFALEPKVVFPGRGAVGIENTWYYTGNSAERLTEFPDKIHVVSPNR